jgi:hypothetical protein
MTRYIIALLLIVIIALASFLYKEKTVSLYDGFPAADNPEQTNGDKPPALPSNSLTVGNLADISLHIRLHSWVCPGPGQSSLSCPPCPGQ